MRSLVTGGAGFIGSSIATALVERGDEVLVFDNFLTGRRDAVPDGVELIEGDLRDQQSIADACNAVEVVFHQAAVRSVPRSIDNPFLTNECNVTATLNVLEGAARAGCRRLVYASSSSVYGAAEAPINREEATPDPRSPYAVSKLAGEHYCKVWNTLGRISTVSLRYFNVFGPGQHPDSQYSAVFPAFISALRTGVAPEVHWDGEQSRDFTFIDDVVAANLAASDADEDADGGVINVASGNPKTVRQVLERVAECMGTWVEPTFLPKRSGDIRHTKADIGLAGELLGWKPSVSWDDATQATVEWFRA